MDDIVNKLLAGGVSHDIIEQLKVGLGNTFETELVTNGLIAAAEKIGLDTANIPHIDFTTPEAVDNIDTSSLAEVANIDTSSIAGVSDMMNNVEDLTKNPEDIFSKIMSFFTGK